nr:unnamed protein product [Digitaria exilis]
MIELPERQKLDTSLGSKPPTPRIKKPHPVRPFRLALLLLRWLHSAHQLFDEVPDGPEQSGANSRLQEERPIRIHTPVSSALRAPKQNIRRKRFIGGYHLLDDAMVATGNPEHQEGGEVDGADPRVP